jgi:hypoxanthine phosphoribosyltransferase
MLPAQIEQVKSRARCLYNNAEVNAALDNMAAQITAELADKNPLVLCVMNGGLIVCGQLATRLPFLLQMDYLHATRYRDQTSGSDLQWRSTPGLSLKDRAVLVVDDILDEGITLEKITEYCQAQQASNVYTAVLVDKQTVKRASSIKADFVGLSVGDYYVFGYGLDYKGYLRNAPGIYAIDPADL